MLPYTKCKYLIMFTDDMSRMRWIYALKSKDEAVGALEEFIKDVADPEGLCIGRIRCDGGGEFKGRFFELAESLGIKVNTNAPYIPQGNAIAERGFGIIIGITRSLMLGATHMPDQLWVEAAHAAVYVCNRTPSSALDGKTPWELWFDRELGSLKHVHEWGCTAFKHVEVRHRSGKLAPRGWGKVLPRGLQQPQPHMAFMKPGEPYQDCQLWRGIIPRQSY